MEMSSFRALLISLRTWGFDVAECRLDKTPEYVCYVHIIQEVKYTMYDNSI